MTKARGTAPAGLLLGLILAVSLHAFHAMAVVTVIPEVAEALDGRALYGAFFSAYLLASLLGLVWAGRALAALGPLRVLALCFAVFGTGVLACSLAPSMPWLVAARVLEGFGGGGVSSILFSVVSLAYTESDRPRVLAWMSGAWVLPGLAGPPLAGWLAESFGWRSVFASVLPGVLLAAALALPALARVRVPEATPEDGGPSLGAASILAAGVGAVLFGLSVEPGPLAAIAVLVGVAAFVPSAARVLPPGTLLVRPGLPAAIATKFLANFAFFGAEAFVPLLLRDLRGWSLVGAGTVLTASALTWSAGAFLFARLAPRFSARALAVPGSLAIGLGIMGILALVSGPRVVGLAHMAWALAGLGMGIAYTASTTLAMEATPAGGEGRTSAALGIADSLGFALAAGIGGALLSTGESASALQAIFVSMAVCAGLTAVFALRFGSGRQEPAATRVGRPPSI